MVLSVFTKSAVARLHLRGGLTFGSDPAPFLGVPFSSRKL